MVLNAIVNLFAFPSRIITLGNLNVLCVLKKILDNYSLSLENFLVYRAIKKMKTQSESSLLSDLRFHRGERILDMDGTLTAQPVLEHVGNSAWPGGLLY